MKVSCAILGVCVLALSSCFSMRTPVYQSQAPEVRGERAISSNIELAREVDLEGSVLGVFYSREVYQNGDVQTLLFVRRTVFAVGSQKAGTMDDYNLSETASMSVDQARKFLSAIDNYLAMDPKSLSAAKMFNFELYSGILDMTAGTEKYRPFRAVTFVVVCSVTNSKKVFKTIFPTTTSDLYGRSFISYQTFELKPDQVRSLREAVSAALEKSTPTPQTSPGGA
jgi:hypothetical protein